MTAVIDLCAPQRRALRKAALLAAAITWGPATVQAASALLDAGGFENYSLGALSGQLGWQGVGGTGTASVQSSVVNSGSKAVQVNREAGDGSYWAVQFTGGGLPSNRFILVDWDMRVTGTGLINGTLGPFFGVESYDYQGDSARLGNFGVDATTGELLYLKRDPGGAVFDVIPDETVNFNVWYNYAMLYDFTLGKYSMYLNGVHMLTADFADLGVDQFTDADITTMAAAEGAAAQNVTGTAYFDNFRVFNGIPGDFDNDGEVDAADLSLWRTAFKTTAVGDADGDLDSDGADFLIWQRNLGADFLPAVAAGSSVPEPAAATALAIGYLALVLRCRRQTA